MAPSWVIPLGISILLAVIGFLVFRGCESSVGKKILGRFSAGMV
jgi:hypothetical protein